MAPTDLVVVVPGILGSTLRQDGRPVWAPSAGAALRAIATFGASIQRLQLPSGIGDEHPRDGVEPAGLMPDLHVPPGSRPGSTGCSTPRPPARPVRCAVMNASTSAGWTCSGGLATTVKNTFRSYAAARTVFGRHRPPRNSRYTSASGTPTRATRPPERSHEQTGRKSPACTAGSHRHKRHPVKAARNDTEDHVHNMHERAFASRLRIWRHDGSAGCR